jgi:hypothetical protein
MKALAKGSAGSISFYVIRILRMWGELLVTIYNFNYDYSADFKIDV